MRTNSEIFASMLRRLLNGRLAMAVAAVVVAGCGSYEPAPAPPTESKPAATAPSPTASPVAADANRTPAQETPASPKQEPEPSPEKVQVKAESGVGKKGHYGGQGIITKPFSVFFRARERIAFEAQVPQAMNLFKASEGRPPKSHEEFMERIIKEQHIHLPELNPDERYIYDPKTQQLMVEQPAR